jgi:HSP20 family protein
MKYMTIRDPFSFANLHNVTDMNRFFDQFFNEATGGQAQAAPDISALAVDIAEDDKHLIIHASLPGFRKEDVNIEVHDGVLTISASRTEETEVKDRKFLRRERRTGSVMRSIALPEAVTHDHAEAELKDGVLELKLPKSADARKRVIAVR